MCRKGVEFGKRCKVWLSQSRKMDVGESVRLKINKSVLTFIFKISECIEYNLVIPLQANPLKPTSHTKS